MIKGYLVELDKPLGKGQYGAVYKARKAADAKKPDAKIYACKVVIVANVTKHELACIEKEVKVHNLVKSENCVRLYNSIKTGNNLYMMMDYCNGNDLQLLLKLRKKLT